MIIEFFSAHAGEGQELIQFCSQTRRQKEFLYYHEAKKTVRR